MFSVLVVVLRPDHIAGLGFGSGRAALEVHRCERAANDAADLCWRLLMSVFGPFCMAHSFVMAGEICSMRHTKDENQRWWHVRHPLWPSHPTTNCSYSQWRKVPRGNAHDFLELIGSAAADYTPIFMNQYKLFGDSGRNCQARERPRNQQPRGSFHAPICPKPAITLSRKDWHSAAIGAVLSSIPSSPRALRDPAPPAAWPRWGFGGAARRRHQQKRRISMLKSAT